MHIAASTAMSIVTELKKIINEDLTFMDSSCRIIACTDESRIGDFHEATRKMLDEGLRELIVPDDTTYRGTRGGINLALEFENEIVGVVGITGEYTQVSRYGQVIKKMTEILLLDEYLKEQKRMERSARSRFVQEWLMTDELRMSPALISHGQALGIDVTLPRRVAVFALEEREDGAVSQQVVDQVEHTLRQLLKEDARNISTSSGTSFVVLMTDREDRQAVALAARIRREVHSRYGCWLHAGLDSTPVSGGQLREGFIRAKKALDAPHPRCRAEGIVSYDDILLEIFMDEITPASRAEFVRRIFRGCTPEQIDTDIRMLRVLYACDGSLTRAAAQLYIHKNTLQYKLNRLTQQTGFDPRRLDHAPLYYLAMTFYESRETR